MPTTQRAIGRCRQFRQSFRALILAEGETIRTKNGISGPIVYFRQIMPQIKLALNLRDLHRSRTPSSKPHSAILATDDAPGTLRLTIWFLITAELGTDRSATIR